MNIMNYIATLNPKRFNDISRLLYLKESNDNDIVCLDKRICLVDRRQIFGRRTGLLIQPVDDVVSLTATSVFDRRSFTIKFQGGISPYTVFLGELRFDRCVYFA